MTGSEKTALDPTKWNSAYLWGPNQTINSEEQYYVDTLGGTGAQPTDPFIFTPDYLSITAAPWPGGQKDYTSGLLTTYDSFCFTDYYREICMRPPCNADGSWPAAWELNKRYYQNAAIKIQNEPTASNDKFNPEIDNEFVTGTGNNTQCMLFAYHYFTGDRSQNHSQWDIDEFGFTETIVDPNGNPLTPRTPAGQYIDCDGNLASSLPRYCLPDGGDFCDDFHTFGLEKCSNGHIRWYIDGELVRCINGPADIIADQEMYFLMNLAVGGAYPYGNPPTQLADPNDYPASLDVEYVRIYTK